MKKIFKMLMVTVIGCFGFTISASAEEYGTEFQKFSPNGTITITSSSLESKDNVVNSYINVWNQENKTNFMLDRGTCNEAYDTCTISLNDENGGAVEQHEIQIKYEEKYSDQFQKIGKDMITITSTTTGSKLNLISSHAYAFSEQGKTMYSVGNCNADYTMCDVALYSSYEVDGGVNYIEVERHAMKIKYEEKYSDQFQAIAKDGKLTLYGDTMGTPMDMIRAYTVRLSEYGKVSYFVGECNADATVCDIVRSDYQKVEGQDYYTTKEVERHIVRITYNKEYSEQFKELTNDGTITIKSGTVGEKRNLINYYLNQFSEWGYNAPTRVEYSIGTCNTDYTMCDIIRTDYQRVEGTNTYKAKKSESHALKINYKEEYSEQFQKVTNGTLTLHGTTIGEKQNLVHNYMSRLNDSENYWFTVYDCNADQSVCDIVLQKNIRTEEYSTLKEIERHPVTIVYGEEEFSDVFKRLTDNKQLAIQSIKPADAEEADLIMGTYLKSFDTENGHFYVSTCSEDFSMCDVYSTETGETHALNITYESNLDASILKIVNDMIAKYPEGKMFLLEDLELINYIVSKNYSKDFGNENQMINFSSEAKAYLGNMTGILDARMGWGDPFTSGCAGGFAIMYNNTIYGMLKRGGAQQNNVIYIPDTTEDTIAAYIVAAQKRINTYLKNESVKVTYGGKVSEYISDESEIEWISDNLGFDISKIESYYNVTHNENMIPFLIIKDSSKIKEEVKYENNDIVTGISISTTSPDVPLDTTIQATEITKENTQYQEITAKLKIKEAIIYDLKLFSSTTKQFISKLKDGLFQVKIPIPESMLNKNLAAYYIREDGKIEEHPITVMDGLAYFTTDHFSVYTITEKIELEDVITEKVPNTYDGIMHYVGLGVVGLIGLSISGLTYKKKEQ